jgi:hypothetical protein
MENVGQNQGENFATLFEDAMLRDIMLRPISWRGKGKALFFYQGIWWIWENGRAEPYELGNWVANAQKYSWELVSAEMVGSETSKNEVVL